MKSVEAQSACMYEIVAEITTPGCQPGTLAPITATAMNDHGVVVGYFVGCNLDHRLPFMWSEETGFVAIALAPGVPTATPMDVNNHNEIVGLMDPTGPGGDRAFHWDDGVWTELPLLPGFPEAHAFAINDSGEIVGEAFDPFSFEPFRATRWNEFIVSEISLPIGPDHTATDINDLAQITGWMGQGGSSDSLGYVWTNGQVVEIRPIDGGNRADPIAINNIGIVAGQSRIPAKSGPVPIRSWVFAEGSLIDLGDFPGNIRTNATDLNEAIQVLGYSSTGTNTNQIPFLWQHGELIDLRTLIVDLPSDVFLRQASAINSAGHVVVEDPGNLRWLVLTPVDRPLGDANIDCVVDERDVMHVIKHWGPVPGDGVGPADMVRSSTFQPPGDGRVDAADLAVVLGNWSPRLVNEPPPEGNPRRQ